MISFILSARLILQIFQNINNITETTIKDTHIFKQNSNLCGTQCNFLAVRLTHKKFTAKKNFVWSLLSDSWIRQAIYKLQHCTDCRHYTVPSELQKLAIGQ
jgi:hypothetical protein